MIFFTESDTLMAYLGFCLPIYLKEAKGEITYLQKVVECLQNLCHLNQLPHAITNDTAITALRDRFPNAIITDDEPIKIYDLIWIHTIRGEVGSEVRAATTGSLCGECRTAQPKVHCPHCDQVLCQNCQTSHWNFEAMKQAIDKLHVTLQKANLDMKDTDIHLLGQAVSKELDAAVDTMVQELEARRQQLASDVKEIIENNLECRNAWRQEMQKEITEAQVYLDLTRGQVGNTYGKHVLDQKMSEITIQCCETSKKVNMMAKQLPTLLKATLMFNSYAVVSAITSFGSIKLLVSGTEDCPVAVDSGPVTPVRPRILGESGTGSGELIYNKTTSFIHGRDAG
jgi:hypothetical protein